MNFETILFEEKDNIGLLTLNRPKTINAMNQKIMTAKNPLGLRMTKEAINQNLGVSSLEQALHLENRNQSFLITAMKLNA